MAMNPNTALIARARAAGLMPQEQSRRERPLQARREHSPGRLALHSCECGFSVYGADLAVEQAARRHDCQVDREVCR